MSQLSQAAKLKEEGNALFVKKNYASAIVKYTKAIALDDKNAVLYANRSACHHSLKRHLDSLGDARIATELDPAYSKAWGRLASAYSMSLANRNHIVGQQQDSVNAYQRALDTLPKDNLTPAEIKQKSQYEDGLKKAQELLNTPRRPMESNPLALKVDATLKVMPWDAANDIVPELAAQNLSDSSAWGIHSAYSEYKEGVDTMKNTRRAVQRDGKMMVMVDSGALKCLTNAIIQDERVFHMDSSNWLQKFEDQVKLEVSFHQPWVNVGPDVIMREAPLRLQNGGSWNRLRPSLAITIRLWIMRGSLGEKLKHDCAMKVEYLSRTLEILEWGRKTWSRVPKANRGAIFEETFIHGVRNMYLSALMERFQQSPSNEILEKLYEEAELLIKNVDNDTTTFSHPPPVMWSFFRNCSGNANASKGFYHSALARIEPDDEKQHFQLAGEFCVKAADGYATDDEKHTWYLHCALMYMEAVGAPTPDSLDILLRIRESLPKMQRIWGRNPARNPERASLYAKDLELEAKLLQKV
ncbi:uncharacterized protein EV420DRAFT_1757239 [Desarmillaria tabescens]|uniref:TPR-like protein n=1 Tax=Armillaria tabescens TaxID=1929756 RepID=A0AA39TXU7_ARMTA|nr:uncharacterized protein EV420DRAFT_1757239 [Desarmillaria tabescens]KAK0469498.1 hypothetical protein EV420DRAFT_1757239 [Desarmillaria tabescens]